MKIYNTYKNLHQKYLALTVTDRFRPTVGRKLLKPTGNKNTSWGDRQVEHIKFAAASASRGAPWRPGAALASARGRRRVARSRHALRESRTMIGYNRLSTPAVLAPSFLNRIALRKLRWIPLATAHTPVCSIAIWCARGRGRLIDACECAWVHGMSSVMAANPPNERK
jgi:hypothetical protein